MLYVTAFKNKKFVLIFASQWMNAAWEETVLAFCKKGGTAVITPQIPKFDVQGGISGILHEHTLKSKEIVLVASAFLNSIK